ncbi:MAG: ABC transporter permease [Actinobacteria bacterium]|nr:ABC transporter permease [Actinomycetota bacterium]
MVRFIIKRLGQLIPVIIGITFITFMLLYLVPGDPARMIAGKNATPEMLRAIRHELGLDLPWYKQYLNYMWKVVHFDFGTSYRYKRPVIEILLDAAPKTAQLAIVAVLIEAILGIIAGVISAVKKYSFIDSLITVSALAASAIPIYWLGMLLQYWFGLKLGLLPISGYGTLAHLILPSIALATGSTALVALMTRSSFLEVSSMDFVNTAYAKGLPKWRVIFVHILRNAMIPVVTVIGLDLASLMGGAVLTETVFAWPGIGRTIYQAILMRDAPVVLGGTLFLAIVFVLVNFIVDILYAILDPRIRLEA